MHILLHSSLQQFRTYPVGSAAVNVFLRGTFDSTRRIHLRAKGLDFGKGKVRRTTFRGNTRVLNKGSGAFGVQFRTSNDISGGVKIALSMTAYELGVGRKGNVALDDTCAHPDRSLIGFDCVLRKLHAGTTVPNRKVRTLVARDRSRALLCEICCVSEGTI